MRVAVVIIAINSSAKLKSLATGLAKGIEEQGHSCSVFDISKDSEIKLTMYDYIAIGSEGTGLLFNKIPSQVNNFLQEAGVISGKRSFAFLVKKPWGNQKASARLMAKMEHEGMFIRYSDAFSSESEAQMVGSQLKIEK